MDVVADYAAPITFIGWMREGRWYHRGETVDNEWRYSMLSFWRREKGEVPVLKGERSV
jgi:hypothetical protein